MIDPETWSSKGFFKNYRVFLEDYVPERLPGRGDEAIELAKLLRYLLQGMPAPNIAIHGPSGSGKSVVVRYVLEKFKAQLEKNNAKVAVGYVSCKEKSTESQVLEKLIEELSGTKPKIRGSGIGKYYDLFKEAVRGTGGLAVVILDEVTCIRNNASMNNILYNFSRFDSRYGWLTVICTSNHPSFKKMLDESVSSSLSPILKYYPPYNTFQLEEILKDRAKAGLEPDCLEDGVIQLCAAISARERGNARTAINLLRTAVCLAEKADDPKVREEHVIKAKSELDRDLVRDAVVGMTIHQKAILLAVAICEKYKKNPRSGDVYSTYKNICNNLGYESVTQRRALDLLKDLEIMELIYTRLLFLGRYGKTRFIKLGLQNPQELINIILEDSPFSELDIARIEHEFNAHSS